MSRYTVLRNYDIRTFLTPEEKVQLMAICRKIEAERAARKKELNSEFFVLNIRDEFAQSALEAYIREAQADPRIHENDGIKEAVAAASNARQNGIMLGTKKLPSSEK